MGLAGDLDGDGQQELVVFNQPFTELMALRRTIDGIEKPWETPVGGKAATNLEQWIQPAGLRLVRGEKTVCCESG